MGNDSQKEELIKIWQKVLDCLEENLKDKPKVFDAYFDQTKLMSLSETVATITANGNVAARILSTTEYSTLIINALDKVTQTKYSIRILDENSYYKSSKKVESSLLSNETSTFFSSSRINKDYNFDNFVTGPSNLDAYRAAIFAVSNPGAMNPIFIYSTTGYGKTHLLNAIANSYKESHPNSNILYTNTDQFIDEFIKYATGTSSSFICKYLPTKV